MRLFIPIAAFGLVILYWFAHSLMKAGKDKPLHTSEYDDTERFYNE
jgi:hypothetical protein